MAGQNTYLHGFSELKQFSYVVRCVTKKQDIELVVVKKLDVTKDNPRDIEDVSLALVPSSLPVCVVIL